jgi:3-methylcrotonyl-CoA carboxylase alpha subunit
MGSKSASKHIMESVNVPIINGYYGEDQTFENLKKEAEKIGYPIMIKAVMGGGGKGMRVVHTPETFENLLEQAKGEAMASFSDDIVLLENYISKSRHIEFQIFSDKYGDTVHLFERDCSVQRRNQKILEESPAPGMSESLRKLMGKSAVEAAKAVNYVGAGTVEFIIDVKTNEYFFMEMNTRLQVEHPVTEMVSRQDLVQWQLHVAAGHPIPRSQNDLHLHGHAIESRIYAESTEKGFLPSTGKIKSLWMPEESDRIRIDIGIRKNDEVSVFYDPMIAKLVVWGSDRTAALSKLHTCLSEYNIDGLPTNVDFLMRLASHQEFVAGDVDTDFIQRNFDGLFPNKDKTIATRSEDLCAGAMAYILGDQNSPKSQFQKNLDSTSPFASELNTRMNHFLTKKVSLKSGNTECEVTVICMGRNKYKIQLEDGQIFSISANLKTEGNVTELECDIDGAISRQRVVYRTDGSGQIRLFGEHGSTKFERKLPKFLTQKSSSAGSGDSAVAPMPGVVEKINVQEGDDVKAGDPLVVMIAMKMEYVIKAPKTGTVTKVPHRIGDFVTKGTALVEFADEE